MAHLGRHWYKKCFEKPHIICSTAGRIDVRDEEGDAGDGETGNQETQHEDTPRHPHGENSFIEM